MLRISLLGLALVAPLVLVALPAQATPSLCGGNNAVDDAKDCAQPVIDALRPIVDCIHPTIKQVGDEIQIRLYNCEDGPL
ncbi:MAG: hypothetical protein QOE90_274 [Thermoplasmata archaeon]|jgi:hypothetical protein|nr:hypothetical protein [Thermoplasmata archaeon]